MKAKADNLDRLGAVLVRYKPLIITRGSDNVDGKVLKFFQCESEHLGIILSKVDLTALRTEVVSAEEDTGRVTVYIEER